MKLVFLAILATLSPISFHADAKMPVEVVPTGDDITGRQLVYEVKERIRRSASLALSLDSSEVRLQSLIVTLNPFTNNPNGGTVYSMVLTLHIPESRLPYYLQQYTGTCGPSSVESCAATIVAEISDQSDKLNRITPDEPQR